MSKSMEQIEALAEETIGKYKYNQLKSIDFDNIAENQVAEIEKTINMPLAVAKHEIKKYEDKHHNKEITPFAQDYLKRLATPNTSTKPTMTKEWLYKNFMQAYYENEKVKYSTDTVSLENLKPLIYYFLGDFENFKKCANVSDITTLDMKKGLLIIGGYGNGKTSVMRAFEVVLKPTNVIFKGYTANEIVLNYENCKTPTDKKQYTKDVMRGTRYFDDVLTERPANNYGKINLFKDILEERYSNNNRTYITCNNLDCENVDLEKDMLQFQEKYGKRVYDRLFAMFNVVEFKGSSKR